ncbi:MAG: Uma2 family endonuclease [Candidatus Poribacteria bacterium]|nr:Uma2 family endonuclease [Candidatus Poribacteria bacterium]
MNTLKAGHEQAAISLMPLETDMTLEEFLESDLEGYEYVKGELIPMPPTSGEHGDISSNIQWYLYSHVRENQLGRVYTSDTGFKIGDRFLIPDIAFVSTERLPDDRRKAFSIPPDLAVEVVSPTDVLFRVFEKALTYLSGGTQLVWVIEPVAKTVTVYRSETDIKVLTREDTLTGEDVVEGFSCQVSQLFE